MERDAGINLLTGLGFAALTCNSALAIYRAREDAWSVAFVVSAYIALLLLFWLMCLYEHANRNAAQMGKQKFTIWMLTTFLTGMFAYRVAALMSWPLALVVWGMAAAAVFGGFYAFFIYPDH